MNISFKHDKVLAILRSRFETKNRDIGPHLDAKYAFTHQSID